MSALHEEVRPGGGLVNARPADVAVTLHAANTRCLGPTASDRWGLTAREAEVLSKVVEGRGANLE
jgi:hypothetical protein